MYTLYTLRIDTFHRRIGHKLLEEYLGSASQDAAGVSPKAAPPLLLSHFLCDIQRQSACISCAYSWGREAPDIKCFYSMPCFQMTCAYESHLSGWRTGCCSRGPGVNSQHTHAHSKLMPRILQDPYILCSS